MQRSSVRSGAAAAGLALAFISASCGNAAQSGVNVKTVATDLTYGIPEAPVTGAPANTTTDTADPLRAVQQGPPRRGEILVPRGQGGAEFCPEAPPTLFPPPAPAQIEGVPAEGTYLWVVEGEQLFAEMQQKIQLPAITQRTVSNVGRSGDGPRFTVAERELTLGSQYTVFSTYEYREGQVDERISDPSAAGGTRRNVDVTGLYLVKIERRHATNRDVNTVFNPSPPILALPQPVVLGDAVDSTGVDPISFEVLTQRGRVEKRERIDACGKPMDVFWVEAIQEFASKTGDTHRRKFHYGIATAMGGLPIAESIESPCVETESGGCNKEAVTFTMDAHVARLEPIDQQKK